MKIVIPGGTGQVGVMLARMFHGSGHEITVLSRRPTVAAPWRIVGWDAETLGDWAAEFEGADAVINLAGRSVNCRYTPENRREILESRVNSARVVGEAILRAERPPKCWLQASTATIYAHRYDGANDEMTGIIGGGEPGAPDSWKFSIDVAEAWEQIMDEMDTPSTRRVKMRSAIIMSPDQGGPFDVLLGLVRRGLGGTSGDGRQYVSWIHDYDFIRAVCWLIEHPQFEGPVNLAAPEPLPNAEFMYALRAAWGTKFGLPAAEWMLEIGAALLKTETELILKSRRVIPSRLLREGFQFEFPRWPEAALDLTQQWKSARAGK